VNVTFNSLSRDHDPKELARDAEKLFDFQLPLSGSLGYGAPQALKLETFNSLSRDHLGEDITASRFRDFQLPLSGSHHATDCCRAVSHFGTFNSLSRDHVAREITENDFGKYLSTPSLGITARSCLPAGCRCRGRTFNSLSRDHDTKDNLLLLLKIPFNSLSRDHEQVRELGYKPYETLLSTPSLGIT
jgi:hypothetical protein